MKSKRIPSKVSVLILCVTLISAMLFIHCTEPSPSPNSNSECFEDRITEVESLITMTEEMPLSEEAKSSIISGWGDVIDQYEQSLEADEQILTVLEDADSYYTAEVCGSCPLVCEEQCKDWKPNTVAYAICWYACLAGKAIGQQTAEPIWPMSEDAVIVELSEWMVAQPGDQITAWVTVYDLGLFVSEDWASTEVELTPFEDWPYADLGPLIITVMIETPEVAEFYDGGFSLEHTIDPTLIMPDGTYTFSFELVGVSPGEIGMALFWKWRILTEGACSVALLGIYAGCASLYGTPQYDKCICDVMADMPAPGSWACKKHPLTFRAAWKLWGCSAWHGASPY